MPTFDGTGPQGKGPLTGRGMGTCKGGVGRQGGMGRGMGRRMRCCDPVGKQPAKPEPEKVEK